MGRDDSRGELRIVLSYFVEMNLAELAAGELLRPDCERIFGVRTTQNDKPLRGISDTCSCTVRRAHAATGLVQFLQAHG